MADNLAGVYLRKRGITGKYDAEDRWCRKWTYKVTWCNSGKNMQVVALTDGMTLGNGVARFTDETLRQWIKKYDMVKMSREEVIQFFIYDTNDHNYSI